MSFATRIGGSRPNKDFDGAPNATVTAAKEAVAAKLGIAPEAIEMTVGMPGDNIFSVGSGADERTSLNLSVNLPNLMFDEAVLEGAKKTLKDWEPTKKWEWENDFELATDVRAKIEAATKDMPGFKKELLDSPALKTDPAQKIMVAEARSYMLNDVRVGDLGVTFTLQRGQEKDVDHKPELEKLAAMINDPAKNTEIKDVLTQRVEKNLRLKLMAEGKDEAAITTAIDKAKADMAHLIIKANVEDDWRAGVRVSLRSPNQAKERDTKSSDWAESDKGTELRAENPLSQLDDKVTDKNPHPALQKSLARAIAYDKDKNLRPEIINFLGTIDMKAALAKEFHKLKAAHPGKEEEFKAILDSELFKTHGINGKGKDAGAPGAQIQIAAGKSDVLEIALPIKRSELKATLEAMAGKEPAKATDAAAPAVAGVTPREGGFGTIAPAAAAGDLAAAMKEQKAAGNVPSLSA